MDATTKFDGSRLARGRETLLNAIAIHVSRMKRHKAASRAYGGNRRVYMDHPRRRAALLAEAAIDAERDLYGLVDAVMGFNAACRKAGRPGLQVNTKDITV